MRHIPSQKTLKDVFWKQFVHDYDFDRAKLTLTVLRNLLVAWKDGLAKSREMLEEANQLLHGHGIEHLRSVNGKAEAYYVNMGDTYTSTILLDTQRDKVSATDWGSWVEAEERAGNRFE